MTGWELVEVFHTRSDGVVGGEDKKKLESEEDASQGLVEKKTRVIPTVKSPRCQHQTDHSSWRRIKCAWPSEPQLSTSEISGNCVRKERVHRLQAGMSIGGDAAQRHTIECMKVYPSYPTPSAAVEERPRHHAGENRGCETGRNSIGSARSGFINMPAPTQKSLARMTWPERKVLEPPGRFQGGGLDRRVTSRYNGDVQSGNRLHTHKQPL
ncbi:hypothetical protein DFH08DRAFT_806889 [Mycena albidolilacea]|uniref:Uncharacterized protein n=1 Tax=Mycena albidolilacea TaxID=1033008 RepID=A0AAD7A741_9AGAR|nr:hypothetical protein DFH08DRAFT_806889 [Mycena albidolilacea]